MTESQEKFIPKANHVERKRNYLKTFQIQRIAPQDYNLAIKKLYIHIHIESASRTKINLPI